MTHLGITESQAIWPGENRDYKPINDQFGDIVDIIEKPSFYRRNKGHLQEIHIKDYIIILSTYFLIRPKKAKSIQLTMNPTNVDRVFQFQSFAVENKIFLLNSLFYLKWQNASYNGT